MSMHHPEVLATTLLTALKHNPAGATISVRTLSNAPENVYAIGGFVQSFDGFNALLYRIVDELNLKTVLDSEEFYGELSNRIERNIDAIREHGYLGAWFEHGELFVDVVECWSCLCGDKDTKHGELYDGRRRMAVAQAHRNQQDAIGHLCDQTPLGYETIYLNKAVA